MDADMWTKEKMKINQSLHTFTQNYNCIHTLGKLNNKYMLASTIYLAFNLSKKQLWYRIIITSV